MRATLCQPFKVGMTFCFLVLALVVTLTPSPAMAPEPTNFGSNSGVACPGGNVICNGSINFLTTELFFEPETPAFSLKKASTVWNELEQLLDNPNFTYTTGPACNDAAGPVPGNEQGYPTYCTNSTFIRRPTTVDASGRFLVSTLPPLLVHPLNYNAPTGTEMRLINSNYAGGPFVNSGVVAGNRTGVCYTLGTSCTPTQNSIQVTSGSSRLDPGETEIDYNVAIGRKLSFCQINPEPVPLYFGTYTPFGTSTSTASDSENLTTCGSDPGEPGAASLAHNNIFPLLCATEIFGSGSLAGFGCEDNVGLPVVGAGTGTWYSTPAVPAPNFLLGMAMQIPNGGLGTITTGTSVILNPASGFLLRDPARGGVIQPLNIATGVGGLHKPTLRKAEFGGNGLAPNYLWNSTGAASATRPDPTGADLQVSNENDFVGLFPASGATDNASLMTRKQAARLEAMVLGKSLFWDMQVGSDAVQSCGSCHAHAGADNRTKNQLNPNGQDGIRGNPTNFAGTPDSMFDPHPVNYDLTAADFPLLKLNHPEVAGDPLCTPAIIGNVTGISFPDGDPPDNPFAVVADGDSALGGGSYTACDASNKISDTEEVASSMGVHFGLFGDVPLGTGLGLANPPGATSSFGPASFGVRALIHDQRSSVALGATVAQAAIDNTDPIPGFAGTTVNADGSSNQFRRVEPRNTPTVFPEDMNFDNFWDGRARHDDNGGSVFGPSDPQSHVFVNNAGTLVPTRQLIRFSSVGSLAKGPALSKFEMSFLNRNWAKIGKKLLQSGVTPLANQLVDPTDSILGRYSNQNGSACAALSLTERSPQGGPATTLGAGVPGLCISYPALIQHAFYPALHSNISQHLNGCYTDGRADIHPNQCGATVGTTVYPPASIQVLDPDGVVRAHNNDPFDVFVLNLAAGAASPTDTNQFSQMEGNFSLFWGQSIHLWATILVPDDTPDDKFLDMNPDTGATNGETGEPLLVLDLPNCPNPAGYSRGYHLSPSSGLLQYTGSCFTEVGNFKRDVYNPTDIVGSPTAPVQNDTAGHPRLTACIDEITVAGARNCTRRVPAGGTRTAGMPDPLLGFDIFFGANVSLKNPQFRSARCGACHNAPVLTDNTAAFTVKAMELDGFAEFERLAPDIEPLIEPLVRERVITGFLLESEIAEPGQDAIERKAPNLSLVPAPVVANNGNCITDNCSGYEFPDAITANAATTGYIIHSDLGSGPVAGAAPQVPFTGFGGAFLDNGVYNIGVRPCVADQTHVIGACEDTGRGNNDPFGWPLSLAALLLKNMGGTIQQPGVPIAQFDPNNANIPAGRTDGQPCAPYCSSGGLLELSKQDQQMNPGYGDDLSNPQLPSFLAHFANRIGVGDSHPQVDEGCGPAGAGCPNTLMDVANEEGFPEFGFDPRAHASEVINNSVAPGDAALAIANFNLVTPATLHGSAQMGTWPVVNRVNRFGSFKAPQLREVELTGPYFHNGGKLTLRQVVDFYVRGGDFPVTNSNQRDFNILNLNAEIQSNLNEAEKVALVDFLLELTDDRVAREAAPFDHPQMILPLDGTAPESDGIVNRDVMLSGTCSPSPLGPGQEACDGGMFLNVPAVGANGNPGGRMPNFLGIAGSLPDALNPTGRKRYVGNAAFCE